MPIHNSFLRIVPTALALMLAVEPARSQGRPIAISHVGIVNMDRGGVSTDMTVVVEGGRIQQIFRTGSKKLRAGTQVVDARKKYLIPGLWDMHVHIQDMPESSAQLYLAHGVTGIRDMRMELDVLLSLRARIAAGSLIAPRLVASGPALDDVPKEWPVPIKLRIKTAAEARDAVQALKANGVDFIKVHNFTTREAFFAIADETKRLQMSFVGHVPLAVSVKEAVEAGQRSIEHLSEFRVVEECEENARCQDLIRLFKTHRTWHTPTLVTLRAISQSTAANGGNATSQYVPASVKKFWGLTEAMLRGLSSEQKSVTARRYEAALPL